jgi:hypothetical protein
VLDGEVGCDENSAGQLLEKTRILANTKVALWMHFVQNCDPWSVVKESSAHR